MRAYYRLAVDSLEEAAGRDWVFDAEARERALEEAAGRDWVFDAEARERALEEAEGCLWAARAEHLREMVG